MADSLTEPAANLLMRVGRHFNRKISNIVMILINNKDAGLLGALAGFAIAIVFTWKLLRSSSTLRRRQWKQIGSTSARNSSTQENAVASNSEVHPSVENVKDRCNGRSPSSNEDDSWTNHKKLNGSRKMTCQLLGVILEETIPEELQERALSALENAGLFNTGCLIKDKVFFCGTENGRSSFVWQLELDWHVDTNLDIVSLHQISTSHLTTRIEPHGIQCFQLYKFGALLLTSRAWINNERVSYHRLLYPFISWTVVSY